MTVIACDGVSIAADGMACCGQEIVSLSVRKIRVAGNAVYALAGTAALFDALVKWHQSGADPNEGPKKVSDEMEWGLAVITAETGRPVLHRFSSKCPYPEYYPFPFADGVCNQFAIGAMGRGATAEEAVRVACESSVWAGGDIQVVDIAEALGLNPKLAAAE